MKRLAAMLAGLVSTAGFTGCYVRDTRPGPYYVEPRPQAYVGAQISVGAPTYVYPTSAAPDPIYEDIPSSPGYGSVWIDGYWDWSGYEWQWAPGHWEQQRPEYVYVQPYYTYQNNNYVYVRGYWENRHRLPRGVVVRDHRDGRPDTGYYQQGNTYIVPSQTRDQRGYPSQPPGRVVIPRGRQQQPYYGQGGTVVVPSDPAPIYRDNTPRNPQGGTVIIPSGPGRGGYQQPPQPPSQPGGTVIIPSGPGRGGYQQPPQPQPPPPQPSQPGSVIIPSNPGGAQPVPGRVNHQVLPGEPVQRVPSQPGRVIPPAQTGSPPPSAPPPGRTVIPSRPQPQQPPQQPEENKGNVKVRDHR